MDDVSLLHGRKQRIESIDSLLQPRELRFALVGVKPIIPSVHQFLLGELIVKNMQRNAIRFSTGGDVFGRLALGGEIERADIDIDEELLAGSRTVKLERGAVR